jgi:hypothetical protein
MDEEVCYDPENDFDASTCEDNLLKREKVKSLSIVPAHSESGFMSSLSNDPTEQRQQADLYHYPKNYQQISPSAESDAAIEQSPKIESDEEDAEVDVAADLRRMKYPAYKGKKVSFSRHKFIASDENLTRAVQNETNNNDQNIPGGPTRPSVDTRRILSTDSKCFIIESLDSNDTPRTSGSHEGKPKPPRRKHDFFQKDSYQSLLVDTSNITPSRISYSAALNKHRSTDRMIHPLEILTPSLQQSFPSHYSSILPSKAFANEFDYVIVFPFQEKEERGQSLDAKYIMHSMLLSGLELYPYLSASGKELFVLIRAPVNEFFFFSVLYLFICFLLRCLDRCSPIISREK